MVPMMWNFPIKPWFLRGCFLYYVGGRDYNLFHFFFLRLKPPAGETTSPGRGHRVCDLRRHQSLWAAENAPCHNETMPKIWDVV